MGPRDEIRRLRIGCRLRTDAVSSSAATESRTHAFPAIRDIGGSLGVRRPSSMVRLHPLRDGRTSFQELQNASRRATGRHARVLRVRL